MIKYCLKGGKCGVCGDPYDAAVKNHELGGQYATGIITRTYTSGQIINVNILVRKSELVKLNSFKRLNEYLNICTLTKALFLLNQIFNRKLIMNILYL